MEVLTVPFLPEDCHKVWFEKVSQVLLTNRKIAKWQQKAAS